jgi:hypothetical protein
LYFSHKTGIYFPRLHKNCWSWGPLWHFVTCFFFLRWGVVSPPPNPQAGGPPFVGCPRLLIQYIRSCPPYLEAFSSNWT